MPTYTGSTVPSGGGTVTSVSAGNGISVSGSTSLTVTNTGVTSLAGTGVTASASTGAVTITAPVVAGGTGISVSGSQTTSLTVTNSGVTSLVAGTGISVSAATGAVTVSASGGGGASTTTANTWTATQTHAGGTSTGFPATTYGVLSDNYGQVRAQQFVQGNLVSGSSITYAPTTANNLLNPAGNSNCGPGNLTAGPTMTALTSAGGSFPRVYDVAIDPTGRFLYAPMQQYNQLQAIAINSRTGELTKIGSPISSGTGSSGPRSAQVDPTGRFLYVFNDGNASVQPFTINQSTGAVTAGTAVIPSSFSQGFTVHPSGRFLYVHDASNLGQVYPMTIDQTSGALTTGTPVLAPGSAWPSRLVIDPSGRFMYSVCSNSAVTVMGIQNWTIDQATGIPTAGTVLTASSYNYTNVIVDPTGRFLFAAKYYDAKLTTFSINQSTGALTLTSTFNTGAVLPGSGLAVDPTGRFLYATYNTGALLATLSIDQMTGALTLVGTVASPASGPVQIRLDPSGRFAFICIVGAIVYTFLTSSFGVNRLAVGAVALQAYDLELAADSAGKPTSTTWTVSSDARIKTVSGPYRRGLSDVIALVPVEYRLNGRYGSVDDGKDHVSVIAQDAQSVWPEMVGSYMRYETDPETGEAAQVELFNLNTNDLQWGLVNAVKELATQNAQMKARLDSLENGPRPGEVT